MSDDRPRWFDTAIAAILAAGALAFVALLAGFGSGLITDEPDESAALYRSADPGPAGEAAFAITAVTFGPGGAIEITNVGGAAGDLDGWFLCQRPSYHGIGPVTLGPGETVTIEAASASIGQLDAGDGEMGLYRGSDFGDAGSIVSYVEWGSAGHGRSSVAVDAGIWPDGAFVAPAGDGIRAAGGATGPDGWS